jgi:hypothetical protein
MEKCGRKPKNCWWKSGVPRPVEPIRRRSTMTGKPLDCVGIESDIGKTITGKHDFKEYPDRPLSKALGRNGTARMPESTQPVTRCHFGIGSVIMYIAPERLFAGQMRSS